MGGLLIVQYAMSVVASLRPNLEWMRDYSIFYYFNAQDILAKNIVHMSSYWVFSGLIIIFTILAIVRFSRRDISI